MQHAVISAAAAARPHAGTGGHLGPLAFTAGDTLWPLLLYGGLVLMVVIGMLVLSYLLGQRHAAPARNIPYESGIIPTGSARLRYGAHFYTVAIFFILFDVEAVFVYAWAVVLRELGWRGYAEAALFIATLFLGLVYVWKKGGLDWAPTRDRRPRELEP